MRKQIYDREYLENYNFVIQDYRSVFDNMLDSELSIPPKIIKLENRRLIKQFKKDVKVANKRAKQKIKTELLNEKRERKILSKGKLKNKIRLFLSKFKRKNKKVIEPESSINKEK